jgi:hypothetical protein
MEEVEADKNPAGGEDFKKTSAGLLETLVAHTEDHGTAGNGVIGAPAQSLNIHGLKTDAMEGGIPAAMLDLFCIKVDPAKIRTRKGRAYHP